MHLKTPHNFVWAPNVSPQETNPPISLNVPNMEQQGAPVGSVVSIKPDGSLIVKFQKIPFSKNGYTLEVCRKNNNILTSIGIGIADIHSPGCYTLTPGPDGISNPSVGDVVRIYGGAPLTRSFPTSGS